jgi:hypothetical protein
MFDNDATGCFDRIIISLAMIAALRLGMPRSAARMHSSVLLQMKYFVKTAHGISSEFYRVLHDYLLYGTGQGSGASPSIWLSLVIVLLTSLTILAPLAMSNLGTYPVQFGRGSGAAEMFLVFAILDMGERSSAAGNED